MYTWTLIQQMLHKTKKGKEIKQSIKNDDMILSLDSQNTKYYTDIISSTWCAKSYTFKHTLQSINHRSNNRIFRN